MFYNVKFTVSQVKVFLSLILAAKKYTAMDFGLSI